MKQAFVSLLALVLMTAPFATPARANGVVQGERVAIYLENFPDTVAAGSTMSGVVTVVVAGNPAQRFRAEFEVLVVTPLGDAPIQSGTFRIAGSSKRSHTLSMPIDENAKASTMAFKVIVTVAGETLSAEHVFTIV
jgi:hypothetical protein